jgi:hypothetical protein
VLRKRQEVELDHKQQPWVVLVRRQREVVLDLARKAPNSGVDRKDQPGLVRTLLQAVRNPQPMADHTHPAAGEEEEVDRRHPVEAVLHRHPVAAVHTSVVHTHHLPAAVDTGSAEEGAHRARIPVEPDKQDRSRNTPVASSLHSGCKAVAEQEEVERRMRVVEGIADYSLDTT